MPFLAWQSSYSRCFAWSMVHSCVFSIFMVSCVNCSVMIVASFVFSSFHFNGKI